jgi:hypothetical protein
MYSRSDGLRLNVYVESRADWHFDSRLYFSRVIGSKLAHNIISKNLTPDSYSTSPLSVLTRDLTTLPLHLLTKRDCLSLSFCWL